MDQLRIFISYTKDDQPIAAALETLFKGALGTTVQVFRDETSIGYGGDIKQEIVDELEQADVLVALIAGGQPASALSWVGYELGTFEAAWRRRRIADGSPKDPSKKKIVGQVLVLCNNMESLGPQTGKRPVILGIPTDIRSEPKTEEEIEQFAGAARLETELVDLVKDMENLVRVGKYADVLAKRRKSIEDLVIDFKLESFRALKGRVKHVSKPTKQVVVRISGPAKRGDVLVLPDDASLILSGGASWVFGKREDDPNLFQKVEDPPTSLVRYETTWGQFKEALKDHKYGAYWLDVIEQAVLGAEKVGAEVDRNLVLVADNDQRHRVVVTTVTTFFNNDREVSLYLIEALRRRDRGDEVTSSLLNAIITVCRFRFAFLEFKSEFYYENFRSKIGTPQAKAKELLMELDYLRSEATHAKLEMPGPWKEFMDEQRFTKMIQIWVEVEKALRGACAALLAQTHDAVKAETNINAIVAQLERIDKEVRPFNAELGEAIARKMAIVFGMGVHIRLTHDQAEALVGSITGNQNLIEITAAIRQSILDHDADRRSRLRM
jgi:hypothetical protein